MSRKGLPVQCSVLLHDQASSGLSEPTPATTNTATTNTATTTATRPRGCQPTTCSKQIFSLGFDWQLLSVHPKAEGRAPALASGALSQLDRKTSHWAQGARNLSPQIFGETLSNPRELFRVWAGDSLLREKGGRSQEARACMRVGVSGCTAHSLAENTHKSGGAAGKGYRGWVRARLELRRHGTVDTVSGLRAFAGLLSSGLDPMSHEALGPEDSPSISAQGRPPGHDLLVHQPAEELERGVPVSLGQAGLGLCLGPTRAPRRSPGRPARRPR